MDKALLLVVERPTISGDMEAKLLGAGITTIALAGASIGIDRSALFQLVQSQEIHQWQLSCLNRLPWISNLLKVLTRSENWTIGALPYTLFEFPERKKRSSEQITINKINNTKALPIEKQKKLIYALVATVSLALVSAFLGKGFLFNRFLFKVLTFLGWGWARPLTLFISGMEACMLPDLNAPRGIDIDLNKSATDEVQEALDSAGR